MKIRNVSIIAASVILSLCGGSAMAQAGLTPEEQRVLAILAQVAQQSSAEAWKLLAAQSIAEKAAAVPLSQTNASCLWKSVKGCSTGFISSPSQKVSAVGFCIQNPGTASAKFVPSKLSIKSRTSVRVVLSNTVFQTYPLPTLPGPYMAEVVCLSGVPAQAFAAVRAMP